MTPTGSWELLADRHARLRWVGVGLFVTALCLLPFRVALVYRGLLSPLPGILPNFAALGISLGAFGVANDTALFALRQLDALGRVPPRHASELAHERAVRPHHLEGALSEPAIALVLPSVAFVLLGWLGYTAVHGFAP